MLRLAVAYPEPHRHSGLCAPIGRIASALLRQGCAVELFAENPHAVDWAGPAYHYLRIDERHARHPFDACLFPLGRDVRVFQSALFCMQRLSGTIWLLDSAPYHLRVGEALRTGRWGKAVARPPQLSPRTQRIQQLIASGRGTRTAFTHQSVTLPYLQGHHQVVASCPEAVTRLRASVNLPVVWLPLSTTEAPASSRLAETDRVLIAGVNPGYSLGAMRLATHLAASFDVCAPVIVCVPPAGLAAAAAANPPPDLVQIVADPSFEELVRQIKRAEVVIWTNPDVHINMRLLVEDAVLRGKLVFIPNVPALSDFGDDEVFKFTPGRQMYGEIDRALRAAWPAAGELGARASETLRARLSSADQVAEQFVRLLRYRDHRPQVRRCSSRIWQRTTAGSDEQQVLAGFPTGVRKAIAGRLRAARGKVST